MCYCSCGRLVYVVLGLLMLENGGLCEQNVQNVDLAPAEIVHDCLEGENCRIECSPYCRAGCDVHGNCYGGCVAGYAGTQCVDACSAYNYGINCQMTCGHCLDDEVCDPVNGSCPGTCEPGFTGPLCLTPCDAFFYGNNCLMSCGHCRNNKPCNMVTGACITGCELGWTGASCDTECGNMTFGLDCKGQCGHCVDGRTCDHVTGECPGGCAAGWTGPKCKTECSQGWYGQECDFHCGHCKSGTCDRVSGVCDSGCEAGFSGHQCRTPCRRGEYGEDCQESCGQCLENRCDKATGICTLGCKPGWRGIRCDEECPVGKYGSGCGMSCGQCKGGSSCNKTTGMCDDGCKFGWQGRYCTLKKPTGGSDMTPVEETSDFSKPPAMTLMAIAIVLLFIALSSTVVYFLCVRPRQTDLATRLTRLSSVRSTDDAEPHLYEQVQSGPWEITKANLVLTGDKLGQGQFGQVRRGYIKNIRSHDVPVAVKSLKLNASEKDKTDFMNELTILKNVGHHPNVVCLVGSCHIGGTLYVAMEYCCHGDLRTHLRNSRKRRQKLYSNVQNNTSLSYSNMLKFALDVASGMAHLAERQIIHRDLAARNVLLDDNFTAKVADFGLSKNDDTYVKTSRSKVPVRWLALESIYSNTYTVQSDVWAFGVLLWETTTFGGTPYHGMDTQQFCALLKQGYRLCRPRHCDMTLYTMMLQCWQEEPDNRPSFTDLHTRLQAMVDDTQIYINIDEEMPYLDMNGQP